MLYRQDCTNENLHFAEINFFG